MRRVALAVLALLAGVGCHRKPAATPAARRTVPVGDSAEATALGREVFELVDRANDYQSSHHGRLPRSLALLGIDTLTRTTVRRFTRSDHPPGIEVAFRTRSGHAVTGCQADRGILVEASLNDGMVTISCTAADGSEGPRHVLVSR